MKKEDIVLGEVYVNAKGRARLVVGLGPEFRVYPGQVDTDAVGYIAIRQAPKPPGIRLDARIHRWIGRTFRIGRSTRASFATWAKSRGVLLTKQRILDLASEVEWVNLPDGVLPEKDSTPVTTP